MSIIIHKYLISGGGTGGHIFPAISIANALKQIDPHCEVLKGIWRWKEFLPRDII